MYVLALHAAVNRPLAAIDTHGQYLAMLVERGTEEHAQIGQREGTLVFDIVALDHLVADQQVLARGGEMRIAIGRLDHTSDALCIQAVHDTFMGNERDVTKDVNFESDSFLRRKRKCVRGLFFQHLGLGDTMAMQ